MSFYLCSVFFLFHFSPFKHLLLQLPSTFVFNAKQQATLAPLVRLQENVPQFKLPPLEPGRDYQFSVYAVNAKGRSDPPYILERVRVGSLLSPYGN